MTVRGAALHAAQRIAALAFFELHVGSQAAPIEPAAQQKKPAARSESGQGCVQVAAVIEIRTADEIPVLGIFSGGWRLDCTQKPAAAE